MSSRSASQEAWSHHHLRRCISMPGALTKCHSPGGSEASTPETRRLPALQAGCLRSGVRGCLPPKPVGSILPASSCSGGVTPGVPGWAAASLQPLPLWSRGLHPWSLRPQFPLLVGTPLMGSGPPSDLDLPQGPYFQARSRPQVLSVRVPIYISVGGTQFNL